jgi:hypothetical protein
MWQREEGGASFSSVESAREPSVLLLAFYASTSLFHERIF